ncbi:MAG: hypothetical protein NVV59_07965 [Chitinophagaceae bacterium]|nr:hypothetical protein [Chitinophagaceae bacterium]
MIARTGKKGLKPVKRLSPNKQLPGVGDLSQLKVWVLYPQLETNDPNLEYYYDFSQSLAEYTRVFDELSITWKWQPVTMGDIDPVVGRIRKASGKRVPVVLNLCDGDEINGTPGISVIHALEKHRLIYTGANAFFYDITTSKIPMKEAFEKAGVPTAPWAVVTKASIPGLVNRVGAPLILKPAVSGGSMGVSVKNVVYTQRELEDRVAEIENGYRGWNLLADGLLAEGFINGPEFTTFVVGSAQGKIKVYPAVERVFHESLPDEEKFLSFDRLWEIYEEEKPMPADANFYEYAVPDPKLHDELERISIAAYEAVAAVGYGRIDIRMDKATGKLYVLEINAQCGISEDDNFTSIGAILKVAKTSFTQLVREIITDAFVRRGIELRSK